MSLIKLTEPSLPLKKSRFYWWIIAFIAGFADFIIGTAFSSMATSIGWLVTGRIICGSV
ncbi:hypothetical protein [Candidatus Coxiella mudrowiae]|uniref:hypothetical protein n=1 Tax=Candidatus Coxiella mudrowiae TaxID=2054173 RepID=UPI001F1B4BE2|nr:hypothetical protein [Candidatus Coxiella mudrowiae]